MTQGSDYLSDARVRERLAAERALLRQRIDRVPAELHRTRPAPDRWSIAEVVEHLARIDSGVTRMLTHFGAAAPGADVPRPPAEAWATPELGQRVRDRRTRIEAPERVRPGGAIEMAEAIAQLEASREAMLAAYAAADPQSLDTFTYPHPLFGPLTLRSWVSIAADHEARHSTQIVEIAEQLGAAVT